MSALLLFTSTLVSVFALGLQSQNVNQGHYWAAAGTSLLIGTGHIFLYKFMPDASAIDALAYYAGGVLGITASMWFHRRIKGWWQERRASGLRSAHMKKGCINDGPFTPKPPAPPGQTPPRAKSDEHADITRCGQLRGDDIN